jgi:D-xylose transport system substrate-binding protein
MKKAIAALALCALLLISLSGCNNEQAYKNKDSAIKIGFIYETMTVERWQRDRDIFVAEAEKMGADVIVKNAYEDSKRQDEIGRDMIDKEGVDVLAIVAYDKDTLKDLVDYAHRNNVKVISYDRLIRNANVDLYISFDNYEVGKYMGTTAVQHIPKGNYLILNGSKTDNNSSMLNAGYYDVLQPYIDKGDIKIVGDTWIDAWRDEVSYQYVSKFLSTGKSVDAIIAANDQVAEGAITALSENRLAGKVFVTGQDAELGACQRIVEGTQNMTVYKPISVIAEGAADIAVKMASGQDIGKSGSISDGTSMVKYIVFEPTLVTKDNIGDTVIKDGFFTKEQVYANVPQNQWPKD